MVGKQLAHFRITNKLGEGGMGVVYEAHDSHLDRAVALKLLPHDALSNPARKQRFVQEAKAASALNHPHIVTIYDIDCADGIDYIAMELIRGRTLEQALSRGKLRLADALKYGVQIADALAAAHAAGIVHRDLKPGNIMITERGDIKVLDFGLAKLTDPSELTEEDETRTQRAATEEGTVLGSAPYMSPEQAQGHRVDARSDIFSFGSVLYEMLSGKRAFRGANRMATMAAILNQEPEPLSKLVPDLPREVERIVTRCLRKDLDRRSQSMAEIRVALQDLKEESESGSLRASAAISRHRPSWPYYAVGGVLIAAAIAAFLILNRPAPPLHATVLTSFVGYQGEPSLSPDGNQFAFTWDGDVPNGAPHVYISLVGKGAPLRLTSEKGSAWGPSWSPDGQSIAFLRPQPGSADLELHVMPALGGPSRRVASGLPRYNPHGNGVGPRVPLPHGRLTGSGCYGANASLYAAPAGGGETQKVLAPATSGPQAGAFSLALSPDGRELAWAHCEGFNCDLYLSGFQDGRLAGTPLQLTHDHKVKRSPLWTRDGKEIVYIAGDITSETSIYRVRASGGEPRRIDGIGANATSLTLSAKSNRLLYATALANYHIWRIDLNAADAKPERFLSSTRFEGEASYSPDGKRIAFSSNRVGGRQIWVADADGTNPTPLTSFPTASRITRSGRLTASSLPSTRGPKAKPMSIPCPPEVAPSGGSPAPPEATFPPGRPTASGSISLLAAAVRRSSACGRMAARLSR